MVHVAILVEELEPQRHPMSAPTLRTPAALGLAAVLALSLTVFVTRHDAAPTSPQDGPFPVEYYY